MRANDGFWIRVLVGVGTSGALLVLGIIFRRISPCFTLLGWLANSSAAYFNGKKMPVRLESMTVTERHQPMSQSTRLKFLCDIIPVGPHRASVGDMLLLIGIGLSIVEGITLAHK